MKTEMRTEIRGRVYVIPEKDVNTDLIVAGRYLNTSVPEELAKHVFEDLDRKKHPIPFLNRNKTCDYKIIVARRNFGCGSSRQHAAWALEAAGIEAVVAPEPVPFARIFFRNCIDGGKIWPVASTTDLTSEFKTGDEARIVIRLHGGHPVISFSALPKDGRSGSQIFPVNLPTGKAEAILNAGGLVPYILDRREKQRTS